MSIWLNSVNNKEMHVDVEVYRWSKSEITGSLTPNTIPDGILIAPEELLKLIKCSCSSIDNKCGNNRCSCHRTSIPCTDFCLCEGNDLCQNEYTKQVEDCED